MTGSTPTLAVLFTYYNERHLLTEALESLRNSGPIPDEILIYDDCARYPAQDYTPADLPVRVIRGTENRGPSVGRNILLKQTTCDYIHYQDADDLFSPAWGSRVRQELLHWPDMILHEITTVRENKTLSRCVMGLEGYRTETNLVRFCLERFILTDAGVYRTERVKQMGGYCERIWNSEDYHFHVKLAHFCQTVAVLTDPLVIHRVRVESRSENLVEAWTCNLQCIEELAKELPPNYGPDLADAAARIGSVLFSLHALTDAKRAFGLAKDLGPAAYSSFHFPYRALAKTVGPLATEYLNRAYRLLLPRAVRTLARKLYA